MATQRSGCCCRARYTAADRPRRSGASCRNPGSCGGSGVTPGRVAPLVTAPSPGRLVADHAAAVVGRSLGPAPLAGAYRVLQEHQPRAPRRRVAPPGSSRSTLHGRGNAGPLVVQLTVDSTAPGLLAAYSRGRHHCGSRSAPSVADLRGRAGRRGRDEELCGAAARPGGTGVRDGGRARGGRRRCSLHGMADTGTGSTGRCGRRAALATMAESNRTAHAGPSHGPDGRSAEPPHHPADGARPDGPSRHPHGAAHRAADERGSALVRCPCQ